MYGFVFKLVTIFWALPVQVWYISGREAGCCSAGVWLQLHVSHLQDAGKHVDHFNQRREEGEVCNRPLLSLTSSFLSSTVDNAERLNFLELALLLCCCVGDHLITCSVRFFTALLQQGGGRQGTLPARAQNLPQYNDPRYVVTMAISSHVTMVFCEQLLNQQLSLCCAIVDNSSTNLQLLDTFLNQSSENESNDDILVCHLCQITFTSLHNKRSHYSGKIHSKVLVERLSKLLSCKKPPRERQGGLEDDNSQKQTPEACHRENLPQLQDAQGDRAGLEAAEVCQDTRTEVITESSLDCDGHVLCNNEHSRTHTVSDCEHGTELHTSCVASEVKSKDDPQECTPDVANETTNHSAMETTHMPDTSQWSSCTTSSKSSSVLGSDPVTMVTTSSVSELHSAGCSLPSDAGSQVSGGGNEQDSYEVISSYLHGCATAYQCK